VISRPPRFSSVLVRPVGPGVALDVLDELAADLAAAFRVSCHVQAEPLDDAFAFDAARAQCHSTPVLQRLLEEYSKKNENTRVLGVAMHDLFVPILTFVFGEAQLGGRSAVISLCRLREEFYGLPPKPELLRERAAKEAIHELGHTLGLRHCSNWQCVMASTHAVERLDLKLKTFCAACARDAGLA
jgi:archaemetzincin